MASDRSPPRTQNAWRSAFFVALGVVVASTLVIGSSASWPGASNLQPPWPSSYPFGLGANGVIAPYSIGFGEGVGTNDSCLFLFVEFNASNPVDIWVIPGGASVVFHNGTPYFSSTLWSVGPALTGKDAIELPQGGGFGIWTANPGPAATWVFISEETESCR